MNTTSTVFSPRASTVAVPPPDCVFSSAIHAPTRILPSLPDAASPALHQNQRRPSSCLSARHPLPCPSSVPPDALCLDSAHQWLFELPDNLLTVVSRAAHVLILRFAAFRRS